MTKEGRPDGFREVFNRSRRDRERRVRRALWLERLDDEMERLGHLGPTRETVKKLRTDQILRLEARGALERPEVRAAEEIRDVWAALEKAMFPRRNLEESYGRAKGSRSVKPALEKLSDGEYRQWRRYRAWAAGLSPGELALTLDLVKDNYGPRQIEKRYGLPEKMGVVTNLVAQALGSYAIMAGYRARTGRGA